jgi:hypothetical protein
MSDAGAGAGTGADAGAGGMSGAAAGSGAGPAGVIVVVRGFAGANRSPSSSLEPSSSLSKRPGTAGDAAFAAGAASASPSEPELLASNRPAGKADIMVDPPRRCSIARSERVLFCPPERIESECPHGYG